MSEVSLDAIEEFEAILDAKSGSANAHGSGRVTRVDADGTAWVHVFGGEGETPLRAYGASLEPGDVVEVRQAANGLYAAGNYSDPAAGVRRVGAVEGTAQDARKASRKAVESAAAARQVADEAQKVAEATNQHFFADTNGAHITDVTQDEWTAAVDDSFSDYDPDTKPYHNQLLNSLGILLRTALNNLVSITRSAIAFYDGSGNAASNIVARFGSDGAQIGLTDESHLTLDYHSMQLVDVNGGAYFHVQDFRDRSGYATIVENVETTNVYTNVFNANFTVRGIDTTTVEINGVAATVTSIQANNIFYTPNSVQGDEVKATYQTNSNQAKSLTFGSRPYNARRGALSVAAGQNVESSGLYTTAFGYGTIARGSGSFAAGSSAQALGSRSAALNSHTIAARQNQIAIGKYNREDTNGDYVLIIGNGTADNARSNALAVTWDGDIETAKDTAWITLNSYIKYRIHHGVCYVLGVSRSGGAAVGPAGGNIGTLPEGARPLAEVIGATTTMAKQFGQFSIGTTGVITVWNMTQSSAYWAFNASYPVG